MSDDDATEQDASTSEAPAKTKRKKKKRRSERSERGDEQHEAAMRHLKRPAWWPRFAREFPEDPTLDAIVEAFERGNYARVRKDAQHLLDQRPERPDDVRKAAREMLQRIEPDPLAMYLLIGACLLLAFLAGWYWTHKGVA